MANSASKNKIMVAVAVLLLVIAAVLGIRALLPQSEAPPVDPNTTPLRTGGPREMK